MGERLIAKVAAALHPPTSKLSLTGQPEINSDLVSGFVHQARIRVRSLSRTLLVVGPNRSSAGGGNCCEHSSGANRN